jgi:hypothetical protein
MHNGKSADTIAMAATPKALPEGKPRRTRRIPASAFMGLALAGLTFIGLGANPAAAVDGKARLAADLELSTVGFFEAQELIPKNDKPRTAKCLAQAMVADIPEPDAARLADIYERRAKADNALAQKWLAVTKKAAPARNMQVMTQVQKICPDLGPYLERVL